MKKVFIIELLHHIWQLKKDSQNLKNIGLNADEFCNRTILQLQKSIAYILTEKTSKVREILMWIDWWFNSSDDEKIISENNEDIDLSKPEIFTEYLQKISKK